MACDNPAAHGPLDATLIPVCYQRPPHPSKPTGPNCGCPSQSADCLWECQPLGTPETRFHNKPRRTIKPCCNFMIPAVPCADEQEERPPPCDPLCFDWTVNEPGPNDSYGINGLNWYDWEMEEINRYAQQAPTLGFTPAHPGFSKVQPPSATPLYLCRLPIECYSRFEGPCKHPDFATDVNYFRDVRCCSAKPPPDWKTPYAQWATNQHL